MVIGHNPGLQDLALVLASAGAELRRLDALATLTLASTTWRRPRRPLTREQRAGAAKVVIIEEFTSKQQAFLDFVLTHYLRVGVAELDQSKLTPLLRLRYHNSISDALADFGKAEEIGKVFLGFQRYLYEEQIAS